MKKFEIDSVNRMQGDDPHSRITHLGNLRDAWLLTRQELVARIERGEGLFFTVDVRTGQRADLAVVRESGKLPYVRAYRDGKLTDGLLYLPACRPGRIAA